MIDKCIKHDPKGPFMITHLYSAQSHSIIIKLPCDRVYITLTSMIVATSIFTQSHIVKIKYLN